jgi:endonuclease IV
MSPEEAILPMRKAVKDAVKDVKESINRSLERTKAGDNIIIVGVGNTSGVGNSIKDVEKASKWIDQFEKKIKAKKTKKNKSWWV